MGGFARSQLRTVYTRRRCLGVCPSLTTGVGADEDIVVSSARAYVSALNKMIGWLSAAGSGASARKNGTTAAPSPAASLEGVAVPAAAK